MKRWRIEVLARGGLVAAALAAVLTGDPDPARAESATSVARSLSREGLDRVGDYIRNEIATGTFPGAILLIQQHGRPVYSENFGVLDVATKLPMSADTIFRLYSMTKPITSVAAMMLVEDGRLRLDDPVAKYIPAFAKAQVGVDTNGGDEHATFGLVPLQRPITIADLLRHTSGITYGFYGDDPARKRYAQLDVFGRD